MAGAVEGRQGGAPAGRAKGQGQQAARRPHYIFRPAERELDEAIFAAFQEPGGVKAVLGCVARGADVNFQRRNADDTTALMAAAYQGDVAVVARLLRMGANPRLRDVHGKTAVELAAERGHHACEVMLSSALMEAEEESEGDEGYVFDVYSVRRGEAEGGAQAQQEGPVVYVDGLAFQEGVAEEPQLVFENDSDWSGAETGGEDDDVDSNDENYYLNDYPEDDPDSEGGEEEEDEDDAGLDMPILRDVHMGPRAAALRHLAGGPRGGRVRTPTSERLGPFALESDSSDGDEGEVYSRAGGCCMDHFRAVPYDSELDEED
jgi:hypothetical protein